MRTMLPDEVGGPVSVVCGRPTGRPAVRTAGPRSAAAARDRGGWRALLAGAGVGWVVRLPGGSATRTVSGCGSRAVLLCAVLNTVRRTTRVDGMKVLITGGAGFIGSTTAKALEEVGHTPVVLDSLLNGPLAFVRDRIFYEGDIADRDLLARVFDEHPEIEATIHMAARIKVPESVEQPYEYYRDNVAKSLELFDQLATLGKPRVLFSSSASLYALKEEFEVVETDTLATTS